MSTLFFVLFSLVVIEMLAVIAPQRKLNKIGAAALTVEFIAVVAIMLMMI